MIDLLTGLLGKPWLSEAIVSGLDIAIVAYVIYRVLLLIKGTRANQVLIGLMLVIVAFFASKEEYLDLATLSWVLDKFISYFILIVVVLFQRDIRRGLAQIGRSPMFGGLSSTEEAQIVEEMVRACTTLASRRLGAIIAIQREADLSEYAERGIPLDARLSRELLHSIFLADHQNPLHDGAVILQEGRVTGAGCFLPLSANPRLDKSLGTRHRAAVGLTEETDALVLVVSEERGTISLSIDGRIHRDVEAALLRKLLLSSFRSPERQTRRWPWSRGE